MNTQKAAILRYMRRFGSITTFRFDSCRLSEHIRELEADGHLILHTPIHRNKRRYIAYSLVEGKRARAAA